MRVILLFFLFFLCVEFCFGQKASQRKLRKHQARISASKANGTVILSLDTIYNKGVPYAILVKKKQLPYHHYTLFSLNRDKLAYIETRIGGAEGKEYYAFRFQESGRVAEPEKYVTFQLEKEVVACGLVENNAINPFGELKFLKKYPPKFSEPGFASRHDENPVSTDIYAPVKRDHEKKILVSEGDIHQDYRLIGRYKASGSFLRFYLPGGVMVAEALETEPGSGTWRISSFKDKKEHMLRSAPGEALAEITDFLTQKGYL